MLTDGKGGFESREPILCVGTVNPLGTKCLGSHYQCVSETFVCYVVEVRGTTVEMWLFFFPLHLVQTKYSCLILCKLTFGACCY